MRGNKGTATLPDQHLATINGAQHHSLQTLRNKTAANPGLASNKDFISRLEDLRYLYDETDRYHEDRKWTGQAIVSADPSLAEPAPPLKLTLAEYEARVFRLDEVELPAALVWLQPHALAELPKLSSASPKQKGSG